MTVQGVDAAGRLSGAAVAAAGYVFVARYLDFGAPSRVKDFLTAAEVDDHVAHGRRILAVHEIGPDDVLAGRAAGVARARQAAAELDALGMSGAVAWWTSDRDVVLANKPAVLAYAEGWASVLGSNRCGVYGDREVLDWVVGGGLARYGWQAGAMAWSGRQVSAHAHIVQTTKQITVGGVACDVNNVITADPDYGQWPMEDDMALSTDDKKWLQGILLGRESAPDANGDAPVRTVADVALRVMATGLAGQSNKITRGWLTGESARLPVAAQLAALSAAQDAGLKALADLVATGSKDLTGDQVREIVTEAIAAAVVHVQVSVDGTPSEATQ